MDENELLEQLWTTAINPDPEGAWLQRCMDEHSRPRDPFLPAAKACRHFREKSGSAQDLGLLVRFNRYEACFTTLYAMDDPGLENPRLKGISKLLKPKRSGTKEETFLDAVWENIGTPEDPVVPDPAEPGSEPASEPFGEVPLAVSRLLESGISEQDLSAIIWWNRFDTIAKTLQLIENSGMKNVEETFGLHESLLSADPSGMEANPGSWPLPRTSSKKTSKTRTVAKDVPKPFLTLEKVTSICFSPNSRWMIALRSSGPPLVFEAHTGKPGPALAKLRRGTNHTVSADSKLLVTVDKGELSIHNLASGERLTKAKCPEVEMLDWDLSGRTGGIYAVCARKEPAKPPVYYFKLLDAKTLAEKTLLSLPNSQDTFYGSAFSPDGSKLAIIYDSGGRCMTIWQWPECVRLAEWKIGPCFSISWGSDSQTIAFGDSADGPQLREIKSGSILWATGEKECHALALSADGKWMVTGGYVPEDIGIWDLKTRQKIRSVSPERGGCFQVNISPDNKILGLICERKTYFYKLEDLLKKA